MDHPISQRDEGVKGRTIDIVGCYRGMKKNENLRKKLFNLVTGKWWGDLREVSKRKWREEARSQTEQMGADL